MTNIWRFPSHHPRDKEPGEQRTRYQQTLGGLITCKNSQAFVNKERPYIEPCRTPDERDRAWKVLLMNKILQKPIRKHILFSYKDVALQIFADHRQSDQKCDYKGTRHCEEPPYCRTTIGAHADHFNISISIKTMITLRDGFPCFYFALLCVKGKGISFSFACYIFGLAFAWFYPEIHFFT